jgi:hypothetical protein
MGKDGKPLAGAAKPVLRRNAADSAVGKDGKPLSGAAKTSYVNKCIKD